jgi:predicted transcriptional regulator
VAADGRGRGGLSRRAWQVLADSGQPMTPAQVRAALDGQGERLAYTTVMTVLSRLVERGAASRQRDGRAFAYTAVADEAELTARRMTRLLAAGQDRAAVLARFVDVLTDDDERVLGELLARSRPDGTGAAP